MAVNRKRPKPGSWKQLTLFSFCEPEPVLDPESNDDENFSETIKGVQTCGPF